MIIETILCINFKLCSNSHILISIANNRKKHGVGFSLSFAGKAEGKPAFLSLHVSFQGCDNLSKTFRSRVEKCCCTHGQDRQHHIFKTESFQRSENESLLLLPSLAASFLIKMHFFHQAILQTQLENLHFDFPAGGKNTFGLRQSLGNFRL